MRLNRREFLKLSGCTVAYLSMPGAARGESARVPVLMYHDISNHYRDPYTTTPSLFAAHMEWLYAGGYRAVPVWEAMAMSRAGRGKPVVITFDDGYASFLDYAYPLLAGYGFRAMISVIGVLVGGIVDLDGKRPLLSWDEYRFLVKSGVVDVGCHTYNLHLFLNVKETTEQQLLADLNRFQETVEREIGRRSDQLAWPYGFYRREWVAVARQAGFRYLFTSNEGLLSAAGATDEIPRLNINHTLDLISFREYLKLG